MTLQETVEVARFLGVSVRDLSRIPERYIEQALIIIRAKMGTNE